jgi:ketosteroid isomerase-like protein
MSRENVEVVRRIWRLWTEGLETGDIDALQAPWDEGLFATDSTFTTIQEVPGAGGRTYVGSDGLREFIQAWTEDWAEWRIELEEVVDAGPDRVVATVYQFAIGRSSGAAVDFRFAMVFTLKDGRVVSRRDYRDRAEAFEAVGLRG